jgi:hypothetical protein
MISRTETIYYKGFSYLVFFIFCSITEAFSHAKSGPEGHSMGILKALSIRNRPLSYFAYAYRKQINVTLNIQSNLYAEILPWPKLDPTLQIQKNRWNNNKVLRRIIA